MARGSLSRYREKRDFSRTPEPEAIAAAKPGYRYLIQKHAASRLHYDFRLELDGVLKSWAVTKGPSIDPHDKRLAVEVEDHPVAYGDFEGIIPKGQYGGGTVMLWDEGSWEPIGDPHKALAQGKLEFRLHGKRLRGEWTLVRMRDRDKDKGRHNWLLIKRTDDNAHAGDHDRLLAENTTSIASGRSMETIAVEGNRVWQGKAAADKAIPDFIPPQLATLTDRLPVGKNWVHEIKFDGYRIIACLSGGGVRLFTRNHNDWTAKFRAIARLLEQFPAQSAILDGEIVAVDEDGVSSFKALQNALSEGSNNDLQYYAFDLLFLDGKDIRALPLLQRKEKLQALLKTPIGGRIIYSEHFDVREKTFLQRICAMRMEGIVSKRADAPYRSGRDKLWLKTKCHKRQEFVIGGFTSPTHAERGIGALLLGYYSEEELLYAGKVGTGFDHETSLSLREKLDKIQRKESPFAQVPADGRRGALWVEPALACEVEFTEWTPEGRLRHPSFQGLREDKPAEEVRRDMPEEQMPKPARTKSTSKASGITVGGIAITHPDRIIYPGMGIRKLQLAEYYLQLADELLPHVAGRPLSMLRCPEGIGETCFFQRHMGHGELAHIHDTGIRVKERDETYMMIRDAKGLITLAQWGVIELHPWGCRADNPDKPDRMIFDLDPDPGLPWKYVAEGVREVRDRMAEFGLESFVKTTGGKGLHCVIPLQRAYGWKAIKAFARAIAESMQRDNPNRYIAKASKEARKGRIFVDYLRNDLTSTAIAPYSARAREGATVAMPLDWKELTPALNPARFTIETVPDYVKKRRTDPWKDFFKIKQKIAAPHLQALKIMPE